MAIIIDIVFFAIYGVIGGVISQKKGNSFWIGFLLGAFLGILGLLIVIFSKNKAVVRTEKGKEELQKYKELLNKGEIRYKIKTNIKFIKGDFKNGKLYKM